MRRIAVALTVLAGLTSALLVGVWAQAQHDRPLIKASAAPAPSQTTVQAAPEVREVTPSSCGVALDGWQALYNEESSSLLGLEGLPQNQATIEAATASGDKLRADRALLQAVEDACRAGSEAASLPADFAVDPFPGVRCSVLHVYPAAKGDPHDGDGDFAACDDQP